MKHPILSAAVLLLLLTACAPKPVQVQQQPGESSHYIPPGFPPPLIIAPAKPVLSPQELKIALEGAGELRFAYVQRLMDSQMQLGMIREDGVHHLLDYNEQTGDQFGSIALMHMLGKEKRFYAAGVGEGGNTILDFDGKDHTKEYAYLKNKTFSIESFLPIDTGRYAYARNSSEDPGDALSTGLFLHEADGTERHIPLSAFDLAGDLTGVMPVCLSADGQSLYARYQPWEGFSYMRLWKVTLADLTVTPLITEQDKIVRFQCHDRSDRIVGVQAGVNEMTGMGGSPKPPSSVMIFDGVAGTRKELFTTDKSLIQDAVITPDGQSIVFLDSDPMKVENEYDDAYWASTETHVQMMQIDGKNRRTVGKAQEIVGMSRDGNILVLKNRGDGTWMDATTWMLNTLTGKTAAIAGPGEYLDPVYCTYASGFDCLY